MNVLVAESQLADYRVRGGMTQGELARAIGVSQGYISLIESGKKLPSARIGRRIARLLGFQEQAIWPEIYGSEPYTEWGC